MNLSTADRPWRSNDTVTQVLISSADRPWRSNSDPVTHVLIIWDYVLPLVLLLGAVCNSLTLRAVCKGGIPQQGYPAARPYVTGIAATNLTILLHQFLVWLNDWREYSDGRWNAYGHPVTCLLLSLVTDCGLFCHNWFISAFTVHSAAMARPTRLPTPLGRRRGWYVVAGVTAAGFIIYFNLSIHRTLFPIATGELRCELLSQHDPRAALLTHLTLTHLLPLPPALLSCATLVHTRATSTQAATERALQQTLRPRKQFDTVEKIQRYRCQVVWPMCCLACCCLAVNLVFSAPYGLYITNFAYRSMIASRRSFHIKKILQNVYTLENIIFCVGVLCVYRALARNQVRGSGRDGVGGGVMNDAASIGLENVSRAGHSVQELNNDVISGENDQPVTAL